MSTELTVLALGAIWQIIQIAIAGASMNRDVGPRWNAGPRDTEPKLSPLTGRLRRAVNNGFEALILFTIAVLTTTLADAATALTATAAWVWLAARLLYFPAYGLGLTPWRSLIWAAGLIATLTLLLSSLF